jgi:hypothetical protein
MDIQGGHRNRSGELRDLPRSRLLYQGSWERKEPEDYLDRQLSTSVGMRGQTGFGRILCVGMQSTSLIVLSTRTNKLFNEFCSDLVPPC